MSVAICELCAKGAYVRLQRGVKLSDRRCECGGHLTMAAWKDGRYVPRSPDKEKGIRDFWNNAGHGEWDGYARTESFGIAYY